MTAEKILWKLAIARQAEFDDDAERVYLEALADIPVGYLQAGCFDLAKLPRADFGSVMPDVGTIRAAALAHVPKFATPEVPHDADPRTWHRCHACADVGFIIRTCPGPPNSTCGRGSSGYYRDGIYTGPCRHAHTVAQKCECRLARVPDTPQNAAESPRRREWVR
jgi:hypothetical protein